jgi:hypothetical protein
MKRIFFPILLIFLLFNPNNSLAQWPALNEIMASNASTMADENGDFEDWIEIFNPETYTINLAGYGLSDDYENPFRWVFPDVNIPAGGFLLVWASGKDRNNPQSELHTNFSISSAGEEVLLTHPSGERIDEIAPVPIPTHISYGRQPDGTGNWLFFAEPTPGFPNTSNGYAGVTPSPIFSHTTGFYTGDFDLTISSTLENAQIFYTLDGSKPTSGSNLYTGSVNISSLEGTPNDISLIPTNNNPDPGPPYYEGWQPPAGEVFKVNVVRAIAVKENYLSGPVSTHSFLVDDLGAERYSLPVFFLNTNRENFFDPEIGIYIPGNHNNMFQRGREWERPMHLELLENDGTKAFSGDMGVRIHGGTTRSRPRKSLRIYARNDYGDSWVNYQLFPEKPVHQYKRFILRNSGNDWDQSVFRDGFMQYLARDLNVETQYYRLAILFLNGEYWGIHNIRDRYDQHYIFSHYGLEEHEMTVVQNNSVYAYGNPDGVQHYNSMRSFINSNNMASQSNFEHVQTLMDTQSFIDEQVTGIFIMNTDWPGNNVNYFRRLIDYDPMAPPGMDGRWRWHILDTDFGFWLDFFYVPGVGQGAAHNTLAFATEPNGPGWPNPPWSTFLLRNLLNNEGFRHDFINRFADLLNTTFSAGNVVSVIDSIETALQPEMQEHIDRWRRPVSMNEWHDNVQRMRTFAQQRPTHMRIHIRDHFNLSGIYNLQLAVNDSEMGGIRINTIEPDVSSGWSGIYFRGVPIHLTAIPEPGYRFSHWSGTQNSNNEGWTVTFNGDASLVAHFEPSPDFPGDELNPPAYRLAKGPYVFSWWDENNPAGSFPPHMLFLQSSVSDPLLHDEMTHRYHIPENDYHADDQALIGFPYKLTGRTRINGLGEDGISFINTGRDRDLGAAVLALDTRGIEGITVSWTGGTIIPNARVYAIRLQYKIGPEGVFSDLFDENGNVIEYLRSDVAGHEFQFAPVELPSGADNQEYVQLRWKYYFTGTQLDVGHGRRDMLRLDNIEVSSTSLSTGQLPVPVRKPELFQNYPNPASGSTFISFALPEAMEVNISLYDVMGSKKDVIADRFFPAGSHTLPVQVEGFSSGIYFYRLSAGNHQSVKKMVVK